METLSFQTAKKMIKKLVTNKIIKDAVDKKSYTIRLTKKQVARKLYMSEKELCNFNNEDFYKLHHHMIAMPLIKLFCSTKFGD
jgi:hypothetical protein